MEMSMQVFASAMQADNNEEGKSKEAASEQMLSCIHMTKLSFINLQLDINRM